MLNRTYIDLCDAGVEHHFSGSLHEPSTILNEKSYGLAITDRSLPDSERSGRGSDWTQYAALHYIASFAVAI